MPHKNESGLGSLGTLGGFLPHHLCAKCAKTRPKSGQNPAKIRPPLMRKPLYCNDNPAKTRPKRGGWGSPGKFPDMNLSFSSPVGSSRPNLNWKKPVQENRFN